MKVCIIERCYQCRYCCFNSEYAYDREGYCYYKDEKMMGSGVYVDNVCEIPDWCPLEDSAI